MATPIETGRADRADRDADGAGYRQAESAAADRGGWASYMNEVARIGRLTPQQESDLGRRIAHGDRQALVQMVEANLRLVIAVAKQYRHEGIELQDLVQEGNIGLLRAAEKFDYRKGYRFSTYAIWWIRQAVSRAVANHAYAIRVPVHIQESIGRLEKLQAETALGTGTTPDKETAPAHASQETLDLVRRARQTVSLERVVGDDDAVFAEAVADEHAPSPFEAASNRVLRARLLELLTGLPERERAIVSLRYGLVDGKMRTCAEVGQCVHLTRERVRQLEVVALDKLRHAPGGTELADFLA